jgi:hypothetical protein
VTARGKSSSSLIAIELMRRLVAKVNLTHTVGDLRNYVQA